MEKLEKCKHGLTIGTCALCRGDKVSVVKKAQLIPDVLDYINNNICTNGAKWINRHEKRFDVGLLYKYKREDEDDREASLVPKCDFCGKRFMEKDKIEIKDGKKICSVCVLKNKLQEMEKSNEINRL